MRCEETGLEWVDEKNLELERGGDGQQQKINRTHSSKKGALGA